MKLNTILLLVILFFVLGCTFNCVGIKENFSSTIQTECQKCFETNIKNHGQEICTRPDSDFNEIIDHIWEDKDKGCKSACGNNIKYLREIKENKQNLTNLVNSKCTR